MIDRRVVGGKWVFLASLPESSETNFTKWIFSTTFPSLEVQPVRVSTVFNAGKRWTFIPSGYAMFRGTDSVARQSDELWLICVCLFIKRGHFIVFLLFPLVFSWNILNSLNCHSNDTTL